MPAFTIGTLPNEPIVVAHEEPSYSPIEHMGLVIDAITAEVKRFKRPGYAVNVSRGRYDLQDIVMAARDVRLKGEKLRLMPNYRGMIVVTSNEIVKMAYEGMSNELLGGLVYHVFDNLDAALAYARANG